MTDGEKGLGNVYGGRLDDPKEDLQRTWVDVFMRKVEAAEESTRYGFVRDLTLENDFIKHRKLPQSWKKRMGGTMESALSVKRHTNGVNMLVTS